MLIAHITDTHIVDKNEHYLAEPLTKTSARLQQVVTYLNQLNPLPDAVLLTGDASDTGTLNSYLHLKELLKPLKSPLYVIPGNHDSREEMRRAFSKEPYMPKKGFIHYVIDEYPVRMIGLDSHVPGEDFGKICEERFDWLTQSLKRQDSKPTLIFMHHPPVKIGFKLFDTINCSVTSEFEQLVSSHTNLLGIFAGHYHHFCLTSYGKKTCFIAPSVAPVHYFAHPQDDYVTALELEDAAITLHKWDGMHLISHVVHMKAEHHRLDWVQIKKKIAN